MEKIPFLDLKPQNEPLTDQLAAAARRVIESGAFTLGPEVEAFEHEWAAWCGTRHAVAVNSGTSALHLALLAMGVEPGDEVITTAHTFIATVEAILYCGARPVYVDIHPRTLLMDMRVLEEAITERSRIILPVHLYGNPVAMDALQQIADAHHLAVLEDACQAHGARYRGRRVGSLGQAAAFSFYPTKNLGALGEGGIITTDDDRIVETCRSLRNHGQVGAYHHTRVGFNYRMTAFQGAMLRTKLPHLEKWNAARRALAARYRQALEGSRVTVLDETEGAEGVYHLFAVLVTGRDRVQQALAEKQIDTRVYYPTPMTEQPALTGTSFKKHHLPVTRMAAAQVLCLPLYPGLSEEALDRVAGALIEATDGITV